jgi:hypothetical protein
MRAIKVRQLRKEFLTKYPDLAKMGPNPWRNFKRHYVRRNRTGQNQVKNDDPDHR